MANRSARYALRWAREIPTMLHNGRVDRIGHAVAVLIATWANNDGTNAFMSLDSLAECAHATLAETDAAVRRLEARGYLMHAVASNGAAGYALPISRKHERDEVAEERAARRRAATLERTRKWREAKRVTPDSTVTVTGNSSVTTESVTADSSVTQGPVTQELGVRDAGLGVTTAGHSSIPPLTSIKNDLHKDACAERPPAAVAAEVDLNTSDGLLLNPPASKPAAKGKPATSGGYTAEFETFWSAYPKRNGRRDGKFAAAREFAKASKLVSPADLTASAKRWAAVCGDLPVDAERWLKNRRWEDHAPAQPQDGPSVALLRATADANQAARLLKTVWTDPGQHPDDPTPRVQFIKAKRIAFIDAHADELNALLTKATP